MSDDEILLVLKETGLCWDMPAWLALDFAKAIAKKEREACAKICDDGAHYLGQYDQSQMDGAIFCAMKIRNGKDE